MACHCAERKSQFVFSDCESCYVLLSAMVDMQPTFDKLWEPLDCMNSDDENRIRPSQAEWLAIVLNGNLSLYSLTTSLVMSCWAQWLTCNPLSTSCENRWTAWIPMMRTESVPAKQNGLPLCWTEISVCILWLRVLFCLVERNGWHATHFRQVVRTAGLHEFRWWEPNPSQPSRMACHCAERKSQFVFSDCESCYVLLSAMVDMQPTFDKLWEPLDCMNSNDENRIRPSQAEWLAIVLNGNLSLYSLTASLVLSCWAQWLTCNPLSTSCENRWTAWIPMMRTESVPAKQNGLPLCWTEISVCILWLRVLLCLVERNGWHATHFRQVVRTAGLHEFQWWEPNPSQPSRMACHCAERKSQFVFSDCESCYVLLSAMVDMQPTFDKLWEPLDCMNSDDENRIRPSQAEWRAIVLNGNLSLYSLTASLVMSCWAQWLTLQPTFDKLWEHCAERIISWALFGIAALHFAPCHMSEPLAVVDLWLSQWHNMAQPFPRMHWSHAMDNFPVKCEAWTKISTNQAFWQGRLLVGKAMIQKIEWSQTPLSKQEVLHMIAFRCAALGAHGRFSAYTKCSWISRWHSFLLISQLLDVVFFSHESHRCSPICFQIYSSKSRYHVELHHPPGWKNSLNWNLEKNLSNTSMIARGFPWVPTSHTLPISGRCSWSSVSVLPPL